MTQAADTIARPFERVCDTANTSEWLAHRDGGVGASEIAILLGASEWGSNLELYYRKLGELADSREDNELMLWGRLLERPILDELTRRAEVTLLDEPQRLLRSREHRWAIATPDGITTDLEPVEVKNLSHGYDAEEWSEQIPEKYYLQCQHQMLVMGAERCLFGALLWGSKLLWEWVPRDEFTIRRIIRAGSEFWGHIERREPPPSDGHPNARKVLARRATDPEPVELYESDVGALLEQWFEAAKASQLADATAKKAKRQRDALADELAKHLGDHVSGMTATGWSVRWKTIERRGYEVAPATIKQLEIKPPKMRRK